MTQKEAIKNLIQTFNNKFNAKVFISNWLEDMNWHTENGLFCETFTEEENRKYEQLTNINYIYSSSKYSQEFVDNFKQTEPGKAIVEAIREAKENKRDRIYLKDGRFPYSFTFNQLHDFNKAETFYTCFNYIWGWGTIPSEWLSGASGQKFVDELLEMINTYFDKKEVDDEATREAYAIAYN